MGPLRSPDRPPVGTTGRPHSHPVAPEEPCRPPGVTSTRGLGLPRFPMRPAAVPGMAPREQSQPAPMCRLPLTRNPKSIVSENLFRGAGVDHWKSADPGAEIVHLRSIEGPTCFPETFFESGNYGIAESHPHTFAELLG